MSNYIIPEIMRYFAENSSFWNTWIISLGIIIILAIFFEINSTEKYHQKVLNNSEKFTDKLKLSNKNKYLTYLSIILFSLFICLYIYLILKDAEFAYHDNGQFTFSSLQGDFWGMPIWPSAGRYWPLGLQEYNLISLFSKTPFAYHSLSIIQLLITIFICFYILSPINLILRTFIVTITITTSSFVISFFGLIFPERNMIFLLAIFIFCLIKFKQNNSLFYLCSVFISTHFLLYYKEPIFIFILGFAITSLIIKLFDSPIWQQRKVKYLFNFLKENWLEFGLIILSLLFFYLYISNTWEKVETSYVDGRQEVSIFSTLISYLKINPVLSIFLVFFPFRLLYIFRKKQSIDLIWDSLAIGNLLYFLAYIKLNIFRWYYTAPVDFIAILYLGKIITTLNVIVDTSKYNYKRWIIFSLLTLIFWQNLHYSSYAILSRKKEIDSKVQVTNFLKDYLNKNQDKESLNLFFPHLSGYGIQEFASFLNYKNFPVFVPNENNKTTNINESKNSYPYLVMEGSEPFMDNLCVSFRPFQCFENKELRKDHLIIFFIPSSLMLFSPNIAEYVPIEDLIKYQQNGLTIFHYQPKFEGIEKILYFFCRNLIDEQWFNAYIFTNFDLS